MKLKHTHNHLLSDDRVCDGERFGRRLGGQSLQEASLKVTTTFVV